jgi:8-oxo-dGTP diphosphatase
MDLDKKFFVAVKGLIFCEDKFLIVQRSDKTRGEFFIWELPGGRMEFGECPKETLLREIEEETGLRVLPLFPIATWSFQRTKDIQLVGINYLCKSKTTEVVLSDEHISYKWIAYNEMKNYFDSSIFSDIFEYKWDEIMKMLMLEV